MYYTLDLSLNAYFKLVLKIIYKFSKSNYNMFSFKGGEERKSQVKDGQV